MTVLFSCPQNTQLDLHDGDVIDVLVETATEGQQGASSSSTEATSAKTETRDLRVEELMRAMTNMAADLRRVATERDIEMVSGVIAESTNLQCEILCPTHAPTPADACYAHVHRCHAPLVTASAHAHCSVFAAQSGWTYRPAAVSTSTLGQSWRC